MSAWTTAAAVDVKSQLFRALAVLRVDRARQRRRARFLSDRQFHQPRGCAARASRRWSVWTAVALWAYAEPRRRGRTLLVADLLVTMALLAITPVVKGADFNASVPGYWTMGALFAWAIHYRRAGGLAAGVLLAGVDLAVRPGDHPDRLRQRLPAGHRRPRRRLHVRVAAAHGDRAGAAPSGPPPPPPSGPGWRGWSTTGCCRCWRWCSVAATSSARTDAELARLAGEQERELRALIREEAAAGPLAGAAERRTAGRSTSSSSWAGSSATAPSPSPRRRPRSSCPRPPHASWWPWSAPASTTSPSTWARTRRPGCCCRPSPTASRCQRARRGPRDPGRAASRRPPAQGRLGVSQSIRGRVADLGGTATLDTGPWGTEWEFVVPRR